MITLTPLQIALLQNPSAEKFFCVKIKDLLLTDYYRDLILPDGLYVASALLAGVTPPEAASVVDRSLYEVILNDVDNQISNMYQDALIGALLRVQVGFLNPTTEEPELEAMFTIYEGIVQGLDVSFETGENGEALAKVTGSNPMAALDATDGIYTSKASLRQRNPADTAFDHVYEGSEQVKLMWGKN